MHLQIFFTLDVNLYLDIVDKEGIFSFNSELYL